MRVTRTKLGDYERKVCFHVFGFVVFVVFTEDMVRSVATRYNDIVAHGNFQAMHCRERGKPYSHLFLKVGDCPAGTIAHEAWHAVRYMLVDHAGCAIDNESIAYHLGYLVDCVTGFKNELIDKEVGVKSKVQEVSHADSRIAQGTTSAVQSVSPRCEGRKGKILPSQTNRDRDSGHRRP